MWNLFSWNGLQIVTFVLESCALTLRSFLIILLGNKYSFSNLWKFVSAKNNGMQLGKVNSVFFAIFHNAKVSCFGLYISFAFELVLAKNMELMYEIYSFYHMPSDKVLLSSRVLVIMVAKKLWLQLKNCYRKHSFKT